jgi:hypothetical protein
MSSLSNIRAQLAQNWTDETLSVLDDRSDEGVRVAIDAIDRSSGGISSRTGHHYAAATSALRPTASSDAGRGGVAKFVVDKQLVFQTEYNTSLLRQMEALEHEYVQLQQRSVSQETEIDDLKEVTAYPDILYLILLH